MISSNIWTYPHQVNPDKWDIERDCGVVHDMIVHLERPYVVHAEAGSLPVGTACEV